MNFAPHGAKEGKPTEMGFSLKDPQSNLRLPPGGSSRRRRVRESSLRIKKNSLRQLTLPPPSEREAKISLRYGRIMTCIGIFEKRTAYDSLPPWGKVAAKQTDEG